MSEIEDIAVDQYWVSHGQNRFSKHPSSPGIWGIDARTPTESYPILYIKFSKYVSKEKQIEVLNAIKLELPAGYKL